MDEQKTNICFEIETTHGEDVLKSVEITRKDLEYYINIVDKIVAGFQRIASYLNIYTYIQLWVKCYRCV